MDTKALYERIHTYVGGEALHILRSEVADPRAELIRHYDYSFEMAFSSPDPYAELMQQIVREHDPSVSFEETRDRLCQMTGLTRDALDALGVSMLESFIMHLNNVPIALNRKLLSETMRFAAYLYEDALELRESVALDLTMFEQAAWVTRLHLDIERPAGKSNAELIRDWLTFVFD